MKTEVEDRVKTSEDRVKTVKTEDNAEDSGSLASPEPAQQQSPPTASQRTIAALPPLIIYPLVPRNGRILRRQTVFAFVI
jgi:hypothetical protein